MDKPKSNSNETIKEIAISAISEELLKAEAKFPGFPEDPLHGAAIVQEECGELIRACLKYTYQEDLYHEDEDEEMEMEAIQTAAMAIRFLMNIHKAKARQSKMV